MKITTQLIAPIKMDLVREIRKNIAVLLKYIFELQERGGESKLKQGEMRISEEDNTPSNELL